MKSHGDNFGYAVMWNKRYDGMSGNGIILGKNNNKFDTQKPLLPGDEIVSGGRDLISLLILEFVSDVQARLLPLPLYINGALWL